MTLIRRSDFMIDPSKRYQTRDGRAVRILCVERRHRYPVVGLVDHGALGELTESWTSDGWVAESGERSNMDLVLVPEKRRLTGHLKVWEDDRHAFVYVEFSGDCVANQSDRMTLLSLIPIDISYTVGQGIEKP